MREKRLVSWACASSHKWLLAVRLCASLAKHLIVGSAASIFSLFFQLSFRLVNIDHKLASELDGERKRDI